MSEIKNLKLYDSSYFESFEYNGGLKYLIDYLYDNNILSNYSDIYLVVDPSKTFIKDKDIIRKKFFMIVYEPMLNVENLRYQNNIYNLINSDAFLKSSCECKGIITFSNTCKIDIIKNLKHNNKLIPVMTIKYPLKLKEVQYFNFEIFKKFKDKKIALLGKKLIKYHNIYTLVTNKKKIVLAKKKNLNNKIKEVIEQLKLNNINYDDNIFPIKYFENNKDYENFITSNIIVIDLIDTNANNSIIELMRRNIPFFVNKLEPVVEYLGNDYPMYFLSKDDLENKINNYDDLMILYQNTHNYLKNINKHDLTLEFFCNEFIKFTIDTSYKSINLFPVYKIFYDSYKCHIDNKERSIIELSNKTDLSETCGAKSFSLFYYYSEKINKNKKIMDGIKENFFSNECSKFNIYFTWHNKDISTKNYYSNHKIYLHFKSLIYYFKHKNYYKINNMPVFAINYPELLDYTTFWKIGNKVCKNNNFDGLYLFINDQQDYKNKFIIPYKHSSNYKELLKISKSNNIPIKNEDKQNNVYLKVKSQDEIQYFDIETNEYLVSRPESYNLKDITIFVSNFDLFKSYITKLYNEFLFIECDLMCPCLLDHKECLSYFGGYVINNEIELFNEKHYPGLNKLDEIFYNKNTNILFRNFFIARDSSLITKIINNSNTFQFTDLSCIVTPYVQIEYNGIFEYDKKVYSQEQYIHIENQIIIKNSLDSQKYFTGNIILKNQKTILICENSVLTPSKDCGSKYIYEFIKILLKKNYLVHFFSAGNFSYLPDTDFLKKSGVYVHYNRKGMRYMSLENFLQKNVIYFDYIFLSRQNICHNNKYAVRNICPSSKLIYITHDLSHRRLKSPEKEIIKKKEFDNIEFCDLSLVVSLDEISYLKNCNINENKYFYYPICYDFANNNNRLPIHKTKDIYFIGSSHPPNIEALNNFLENIWCHILSLDSNIKFHIIGSSGTFIKDSYKNVVIHGLMSDYELNNFLNTVRISIVPLLNGAGVKGKVLQAFNNLIPVISTNIGIQGLDISHESEVVVIDLNNSVQCAKDIYYYYHNVKILEICCKNANKYFNSNFSANECIKYMDKMFKVLDTPISKESKKYPNCLILCVVYRYLDSINMIYNFFKKFEFNVSFTFYFIINNEDHYDKAQEKINSLENSFFMKGDNSCFEFSGFQSSINIMKNNNILDNFDSILLTNETLLTHYPIDHILNLDKKIFASSCKNIIVYGLIDKFSLNTEINSLIIGEWLRGNFILMNMNILKTINYKIQNFKKEIVDDYGRYKLLISKQYENKIDNWLLNDRYKSLSKNILAVKKTCILNEHYLGALLKKFMVINLKS